MNRLDYIHNLLLDWGQWVKAGHTCQGLYIVSKWPAGRPIEARRATKRQNPTLTPTQPKQTRITRPSSPILRFDRTSELINPVIIRLPDLTKRVVCCLYVKGLCFQDTSKALGLTSRQVGNNKHKALTAIDKSL